MELQPNPTSRDIITRNPTIHPIEARRPLPLQILCSILKRKVIIRRLLNIIFEAFRFSESSD